MKQLVKVRPNRQSLTWLFIMLAAAALLSWRLGTLVPALAGHEHALPPFRDSLSAIWNQPLNLPIKLSRLLAAALLPDGRAAASRLPSALLGLVLVSAGYWLLRRWYGVRIAFLGSLLLISAPWFLHVSRLATGDVSFPLAMMLVLALGALWHDKQRPSWVVPVSAVILSLIIYVPGVIWLILSLKAVEHKNVVKSYRQHPKASLASLILTAVIIAPLVNSLIINWHLYRSYLGLPAQFPTASQFGKQFIQVWQHIFIGGYHNPLYNIGGLPVVSALISVAFLTGVYLYATHPKAKRTHLLLTLWLIGTALVALGGPVRLSLLLPIVFVLAVGGIAYWLHKWLRVFPRNPLARGFGIGLIGLVIAFAVTYNLRSYFVAWAYAPATKALFSQQL